MLCLRSAVAAYGKFLGIFGSAQVHKEQFMKVTAELLCKSDVFFISIIFGLGSLCSVQRRQRRIPPVSLFM
jgi:hypothetical protein